VGVFVQMRLKGGERKKKKPFLKMYKEFFVYHEKNNFLKAIFDDEYRGGNWKE